MLTPGLLQMGEFESSFVDTEPGNEGDEEDNATVQEPTLPAPPPSKFRELPMRVQFLYLLPVLQRVVKGEYGPAQIRHESFMKGGRKRSALSATAGAKGNLTQLEVERLLRHIVHFAVEESVGEPQEHEKADPMDVDAVNGHDEPVGEQTSTVLLATSDETKDQDDQNS